MLPEASTQAPHIDAIFFALCAVAGAIVVALFALIVGFSLVYRRGSKAQRKPLTALVSREVEISWTVATLFAFLFIFWWAASSQLSGLRAPAIALEIHVVAKQWMWKFQHPNGAREINDLHVPVGRPIRLEMISQDVIHSFYVPAFRAKQDLLPGRYTELWFTPSRIGIYRLECAEFCGLDHAGMVGRVIVMAEADYARWLASAAPHDDLAAQGHLLYVRFGCSGCHEPNSGVHAPALAGISDAMVTLADGRAVRADDAYLRQSILLPNHDVVAGFDAAMPSYDGVASEQDVNALIAYLHTLRGPDHGH